MAALKVKERLIFSVVERSKPFGKKKSSNQKQSNYPTKTTYELNYESNVNVSILYCNVM